MKKEFVVFLMAGGSGVRFWPRSRIDYPKQFHTLIGNLTLLEESWARALKLTKDPKRIFLAGTDSGLQTIHKLLPNFPLRQDRFIREPERKNTAPICALASLIMHYHFPSAIQFFLPVDSFISNDQKYVQDLKLGAHLAQMQNAIVTIGVSPTRPEIGYGYMFSKKIPNAKAKSTKENSQTKKNMEMKIREKGRKISRFMEKPGIAQAREYYKRKKTIFWNAGIFIASPDCMAQEFSLHAPKIFLPLQKVFQSNFQNTSTPISKALPGTVAKKNISTREIQRIFRMIPPQPIDTAVMEKSNKIFMISASFAWDDLGSWLSQERLVQQSGKSGSKAKKLTNVQILPAQAQGEAAKQQALVTLNAKGNVISTSHSLVALLDAEDLFIIEDNDVLFIAHRNGLAKIRKIIEQIRQKKSLRNYL